MPTDKTFGKTAQSQNHFEMPNPPEHEPDDMTSFNHLSVTGGASLLTQHLGNPDTTLVAGEHDAIRDPTANMEGLRYPYLMIAFGVDPEAYYRSNAYIILEQGKPPDFGLEIASHRTGREDVTGKREDYAALGIAEY